MLLGIHLTVLIGRTVAVPASPEILAALKSVEVKHRDDQASGFQVVFEAGRSGPADLADYKLLSSPLLRPFSRVCLVVTFGGKPRVLMDGFITNQELSPSNEPGASTLTITGEDVSVMLDMEEKAVEHPAQDETAIANKLIASYAQYGLIPKVIPPTVIDPPIATERIPVQQDTDLEFLKALAKRHGYVFYVTPGPVPLTNTAYWGPPNRLGTPQPALSVNLGAETNVVEIDFQNNALAPATVSGHVQDRSTNKSMPVQTSASVRVPLTSQPASVANQPNVRTRLPDESTGLTYAQALSRAQGLTDSSSDDVVTATGALDAARYGDILKPRGLVDLRGAGYTYDGAYYVKEVTHKISRGAYRQSFTLTREGTGALLPVVQV